MYEEGTNTFVRDLLIKIVLILLFIFLLIWLFPMPNLETFYDRIFADNIKTMQETAKDYFTVDRLPKNVGDKKILTLREMLDEKLIIEFIDRDGNKCDDVNSYVEVVRMEDEFVFKTTLSCPTKTDYVVNHYGCYDICGESCGEKQNTDLEYQFYRTYNKEVVDKYYCAEGYTLNNNKCIKSNSITDTEKAEKKCDTGYSYNSTTNKCEKTTTTETNANPCSKLGSGYSFVNGKCVKTTTTESLADPCKTLGTGYSYNSITKTCDKTITVEYAADPCRTVGEGYTLQNGICVKYTSTEVTADPCKTVGEGYTLQNGLCVKTITNQTDADPCSQVGSGYTYNISTNKCTKQVNLTGEVTYSTKWSCATKHYTSSRETYTTSTFKREFIKIDELDSCTTNCSVLYWFYKECNYIKYDYGCTDSSYNYLNGSCTKVVTDSKDPIYSCTTGVVSGSKCLISSVDTKPVNYSCTTGVVSGSRCVIPSTDTKPVSYSCTVGTVNGSKCLSTALDSKAPIYSCTVGTLSGVKCITTITTSKDPQYSCTTGTVSGSKCIISSTEKKDVTYVCKEGFTSAGDSCYKTSTIEDIKDANATYKTVKKTEYKWSKEITLKGWTSTGKTRELTCTTTCK